MKIAYITCQTPFGKGENFIINEMLFLKKVGINLSIIPRSPTKYIFHKEALGLAQNTIFIPIVNLKILCFFIITVFKKPSLCKYLFFVIRHSKKLSILIKNLIVIPKGFYLADILEKKKVDHIHAHWGSTTATMAWLISELTGIGWSLTLHRWDIKENNMLKEKSESAKFVRCISEHGKKELLSLLGTKLGNKIKVVHMGVNIPEIIYENKLRREKFLILVPADLLPVKGHSYLIEACAMLVNNSINNFECIFYGEGFLKKKLEELIKEKGLNDFIKIPGMIPHENLMAVYKKEQVDMVVLPSINTEDSQHEGIPVSLMEAMAYSIPVISTNTGGIPELLRNEAGLLVEESNVQQLFIAIKTLFEDENMRKKIGRNGYESVSREFNVQKNTKRLLNLMKAYPLII